MHGIMYVKFTSKCHPILGQRFHRFFFRYWPICRNDAKNRRKHFSLYFFSDIGEFCIRMKGTQWQKSWIDRKEKEIKSAEHILVVEQAGFNVISMHLRIEILTIRKQYAFKLVLCVWNKNGKSISTFTSLQFIQSHSQFLSHSLHSYLLCSSRFFFCSVSIFYFFFFVCCTMLCVCSISWKKFPFSVLISFILCLCEYRWTLYNFAPTMSLEKKT